MTQENLEKSLEVRRLELTEALKEKLNQLFALSVDDQEPDEVGSMEFATNMCLSECFRSVGYWDNQLHQTIHQIQKSKNEKVQ